ncbi:MAG TPA: TonB-dependent receptor, partial [Chryseosolibacter sp.]|nr:TonB-dependent receptor [Chryseosolibacter sp.]
GKLFFFAPGFRTTFTQRGSKMKALFIFLITNIAYTAASGQTKISGRVADPKGNPVVLANVFLTGTFDGASTDESGRFEFFTLREGSKELQVSHTGFKDFRKNIALGGEAIFVTIQLQEEIHSLDAVTITAGTFAASDQARTTIFRAVDIATTAGATADIAGALNTLPGTQKVGESGRLFVRGGDGYETRTFIDGQIVLDAYSSSAPNAPSRGRFLPFMFKGTSFSTGGYSAEYGQALSSILALESKDKSEITRTDFGILSVGTDVGHTQAWDRGSIGGKIQYTNLRPYFGLIQQNFDWKNPPSSIEGHAAFRKQSGKEGLLKLYGNFNQANLSLFRRNIDDESHRELYDLDNRYNYLNASYKNLLSSNWMVRGGFSYTRMENRIVAGQNNIEEDEHAVHGKTVFEGSLSERVEIKTGIEIIDRNYVQRTEGVQQHRFHEFIASTFAEADVYESKRFVSRGGVRFEYNALNNEISFDPRFSLACKTSSAGQVSLAYGAFRQSPRNELLRINPALESERAHHYILNYQHVDNNRTFRIEAYHKRYRNLVKFKNGPEHDMDNSGYGFAEGVELFWRDNKSWKNVDYWISYSFLSTKRNYVDFPMEATPPFASKHNASIVYKHFITSLRSQSGVTWSYTSGRPYHDPNTPFFNAGKTPAYQDLSFNWSYLPNPSLIIYFSCTNVLGRENIFGYEFSKVLNDEGRYSSRAIGLPAKRFLFIGIFITLSKEKSVNQLPNL